MVSVPIGRGGSSQCRSSLARGGGLPVAHGDEARLGVGAALEDRAEAHEVHRDRLDRPDLAHPGMLRAIGVDDEAQQRQAVALAPREVEARP